MTFRILLFRRGALLLLALSALCAVIVAHFQPSVRPWPAVVMAQGQSSANQNGANDAQKPPAQPESSPEARQDHREIATEHYLTARGEMRRMPRYSTTRGQFLSSEPGSNLMDESATWTELGPGNLGGRTRSLVIHPTNPNLMYAASVGGGVWKTTDGGNSWVPLTDLLPNLAVSTLVMDPKNPAVLYAGTGENVYSRVDLRGAGIFKTTDGGATWNHLTTTKTKDFYYTYDLVVSPVNSQRVYAATNSGVWRSVDGGGSWVRILGDQNFDRTCYELAIRGDQQADLLFAVYQNAIHRNPDAGGAGIWEPVTPGSAGFFNAASIAIAPSNQDIVYALLESGKLLRSTAGGAAGTWTTQNDNDTAIGLGRYLLSDSYNAYSELCRRGPNRTFDFEFNRGGYSRAVAVDPTDPNRVWVGGVDLFRSNDGGINWGQASYQWADKASPQYVHADQKLIVFHPQYDGASNQTMFVTNDGGIYRTNNARATIGMNTAAICNPQTSGVAWTSLNKGYNITQFYEGLPVPGGKSYVGATQSNGLVRGADVDGINGWRQILSGNGVGDVGSVAIDPSNPSIIYATKADARASVWKTTDAGRTFSQVVSGVLEPGSSPSRLSGLAMDPSDPLRLWLSSYGSFRTADGAARWRAVSGPTLAPFTVIAPTDSNYVMSADYRTLYFTTAGLAEVPDWRQPNPRYNPVTNGADPIANAAFDPANKRVAYIVYAVLGGKHVWRTVNAGVDWQAIDGTGATALPDVPVNCIAVDPNNTARLYIGTEMGVFVSTNGGANWAVENTGFIGVPVESLSFINADGVTSLYAFTNGRGAWRVATGSAGCQQTLSAASTTFNATGGGGMVNVASSTANCPWTAESNADWIAINSGGSGSGAGTLRFTVAANPAFTPRTGTITIAGHSFNISQSELADTTPPVISIQFPAANPFRTRSRVIGISFSLTDNIGVKTLSVSNDRGGTSDSPTTSIGSGISVALQPGLNNITITVRDAANNAASVARAIIFSPEYGINTFAGTGQAGFSGDGGQAAMAQLNVPYQLAFDRAGNLYVADAGNYRIRKISPAGIISTVAGTGTPANAPNQDGDGGLAIAAKLQPLRGLTVADNGDIYFLEGFTHLRRIAADTGILTTIAKVASVFHPASDVAIDGQGNFLVTGDGENVIYKITPGGAVSTFAGTGNFSGPLGDGGPATQATLNRPNGILLDKSGNVIFADYFNRRIRRITPNGIINTIAGIGDSGSFGDGGLATAAYLLPFDLALDSAGNLLFSTGTLADGHFVRKISTDGAINTIAGNGSRFYGGDGGLATSATLSTSGIAVDGAGNIYVADSENHRIRKLTPLTSSDTAAPTIAISSPTSGPTWTTLNGTLYLSGTAADDSLLVQVSWKNDRGGSASASGTTTWSAQIPLQPGVNNITVTAWDAAGNASTKTLAVTYNAAASFNTIVGSSVAVPASSIGGPYISGGFSGDGGSATAAKLDSPRSVARDNTGNLYIADTANHRVRRVAPDGTISTFAGSGTAGSGGDEGPATAASLNQPQGLAVDPAGNVYIADTLNHRVRKVTPAGIISTVAGTGIEAFGGDGGAATAAQLAGPRGLAIDGVGNLFIADSGNHRIRRVDVNTRVITTAAGGGYGYAGDNGPATEALFRFPFAVTVDPSGNLYIADTGNYRIRKVSATGTIKTIAGIGQEGYGGENVLATTARLGSVTGLAIDSAGNLFAAESTTQRIRRITPNGILGTVAGVGYLKFDDFGSASGDGLVAQLNTPSGVAVGTAGKIYIADTGNHRVISVTILRESTALTSVSAASYYGTAAARDSIAAAFGQNLSSRVEVASTLPLPTELAGVSVRVRDSNGVERLASLFFVSPGQINFLIPPETALGVATITTANRDGELVGGGIFVLAAAPGLFSANADGQGVPAASVLRIRGDSSQTYEPVAQFDAAQQRFVPRPIDLGAQTDQVFLILFGTGIRGRSSLAKVTAQIGGEPVEILYAGPQGDFVGLDQVNLKLPRTLAGRGEIEIKLSTDGTNANPVRINIR